MAIVPCDTVTSPRHQFEVIGEVTASPQLRIGRPRTLPGAIITTIVAGLFVLGVGLILFTASTFVTPLPAASITVDCSHATPGVTYVAQPIGGKAFTFTCLTPAPAVAQ